MNLLNRQFDPVLLSVTYQEILAIAEKGPLKVRKQASIALRLAQKCRIVQVKQGKDETPDDVIVRMAQELNCLVATSDRILRQRLRRKRIPVIFLREKQRLALEGAF